MAAHLTSNDLWKAILGVISSHGTETNSAEVIPDKIDPYVRELHDKLSSCACRRGSCAECASSRKVLLWTWEKLDSGF